MRRLAALRVIAVANIGDPDRGAQAITPPGNKRKTVRCLLSVACRLCAVDLQLIEHEGWSRNGESAQLQLYSVLAIAAHRLTHSAQTLSHTHSHTLTCVLAASVRHALHALPLREALAHAHAYRHGTNSLYSCTAASSPRQLHQPRTRRGGAPADAESGSSPRSGRPVPIAHLGP